MNRKSVLILSVIILVMVQACSDDKPGSNGSIGKQDILRSPAKSQNEIQSEPRPKEEPRALKVGVIGPETGSSAYYGLSVLEGILMAAKTFNANSGINGKMIEVIHFDNKDDPELTNEAVRELIQQRVVAIFAAPTGWSTFSATHLANASQTIFISVGSRRRIGKSGPYIFRFSLADEFATDELIDLSVNSLGYTNYVLVTSSDYDYSLDLSALFRKAVAKHGGTLKLVADTYDTYSGKSDIDHVVKMLKQNTEPLHAIIYTGNHEQGVQLAQAIKQAGLKLPIIGGEDLHTDAFLKMGKSAVRGSLLYTSFAPENNSSHVVKFMQDYKKHKGGTPARFVALAYDSFMLVAASIKVATSTRSSEIRNALVTTLFHGVTGDTRFTPQGSPVKQSFIYRVEAGKTGEKFVLIKPDAQVTR